MQPRSRPELKRSQLLQDSYRKIEDIKATPVAILAAMRLLDQVVADGQFPPRIYSDEPGSVVVDWMVTRESVGLHIDPDGAWESWHNLPGQALEHVADGGPDDTLAALETARLHEALGRMSQNHMALGWAPR